MLNLGSQAQTDTSSAACAVWRGATRNVVKVVKSTVKVIMIRVNFFIFR